MLEISLGELCDRLSIVNLKVGFLEADIRNGKELPLEEVGRRALEIRDLNRERWALKNEINRRFDPTAFKEVKVRHASA